MFQRSWVQIPGPYAGWTFFTYICCKNCNDVCLKRPKINDKRGRGRPIFLKKSLKPYQRLFLCRYLANFKELVGIELGPQSHESTILTTVDHHSCPIYKF